MAHKMVLFALMLLWTTHCNGFRVQVRNLVDKQDSEHHNADVLEAKRDAPKQESDKQSSDRLQQKGVASKQDSDIQSSDALQQKHPSLDCRGQSICSIDGLKSLDVLKVHNPPPGIGASPFSNKSDKDYHFKGLGGFYGCGWYYLQPPKKTSEKLVAGNGCEVLVNNGTERWRAAMVNKVHSDRSFTVSWRDGHHGQMRIAHDAEIRAAWSFWAATAMTVYLDFFASDASSEDDIEEMFSSAGWERSSVEGTKVKWGQGKLYSKFTYGPGLVLQKTFAAGMVVTIPVQSAWKDSVLIFAKGECEMARTCNDKIGGWTYTGDNVGGGAQGAVVEVIRYPPTGEQNPLKYALKTPRDEARDGPVIAAERQVMLECAACENVIDVTDATPCIYFSTGGVLMKKAVPFGYVTRRLAGNMDSWLHPQSPEGRDNCLEEIHEQLYSGIQCMHDHGWSHGDFKTDNALYSYPDGKGCPAGVKLIDFGYSDIINKPLDFIPNNGYALANHMVGARFVNGPIPHVPTPEGKLDPLGVLQTAQLLGAPPGTRMATAWINKEEVDWCSYLLIMRNWYGPLFTVDETEVEDCGMMGGNRQTWVRGDKNIQTAAAVQAAPPDPYFGRMSALVPQNQHPAAVMHVARAPVRNMPFANMVLMMPAA